MAAGTRRRRRGYTDAPEPALALRIGRADTRPRSEVGRPACVHARPNARFAGDGWEIAARERWHIDCSGREWRSFVRSTPSLAPLARPLLLCIAALAGCAAGAPLDAEREEEALLVPFPQPWELDASFAGDGETTLESTLSAVDGLGRLVVLRRRSDGVLIVTRLRADGQRDPSFGRYGSAQVLPALADAWLSLRVDVNGRPLIGASTRSTITVTRLTSSGALDGSFGVGGVAQVLSGGNIDRFADIDSDGSARVLVAYAPVGEDSIVLARLTSSGVIDTSGYGFGGRFAIYDSSGPAREIGIIDLDAEPDGTALALAIELCPDLSCDASGHRTLLARATVAGLPDWDFGAAGTALLPLGDLMARSFVERLADGRIALIGHRVTGGTFELLGADGALDPSTLEPRPIPRTVWPTGFDVHGNRLVVVGTLGLGEHAELVSFDTSGAEIGRAALGYEDSLRVDLDPSGRALVTSHTRARRYVQGALVPDLSRGI